MQFLNLIENVVSGYDNLRALISASQSGQDAVLNIGGETITLDPMETRWIFAKYKSYNKAGRQEEFIRDLADPQRFDLHMKQLRQLIDKQKNFRGSVPGQRGVTGDVPAGVMEGLEEIALQDPNNPTEQNSGKLNWTRMIQDYMGNKPFTEFEFGKSDKPLTVYRTQMYAILKAFGNMKPQQKVNVILNTFGNKLATVEYLDKLRAKKMIPQKVPAYVSPEAEPVSPGQMALPGMEAPKIKEAQKKNPEDLDPKTVVNPKVARAFQLARAQQPGAASDIEAFVRNEIDKGEQAQADIEQLKTDNDQQEQNIRSLSRVVQQQNQTIDALKSLPAVVPEITPAAPEPTQVAQPQVDQEPEAQPQQQPTAQAPTVDQPEIQTIPQPVPSTVKKPAPKKKPAKKAAPEPVEQPAKIGTPGVIDFEKERALRRKKTAEPDNTVAAALTGIDLPMTGTYGALQETHNELHVGDPVIIQGNTEFTGKNGDVVDFGRDKNFVIVDLYNFGRHAFHASNVSYNEYADQEVDEGRFKNLDIERQYAQTFKRKEQSAGEQEPVGDFRVVRRKEGTVSDLKQHHSSNKAFAHAQAIKNKYPSMEIGVRWPTGQINWVGIKEDAVGEMQTKMDRFNINRGTPGGTNRQREEFLDARDRLFRQMNGASPGEKEAIRLKIADLEGRAQSQGIRIREAGEFNRAGYNAIKSVDEWREKIRVMQELMKDKMLMSDPEAKEAIEQRIGDLIRMGQQQGYMSETLNGKAMAVLRGLQQPAQPATAAVDLNVPATAEPEMDLATVRKKIAQLDELIKLKELIDKLFVRAQNVRGGIYPGLQSDIEDEELYPVPQTDRDYQDLKNKYTKDLAALQKFLAMKKAVYREDEDRISESTALVRLQQARKQLAQQGVAEGHADQQRKIFKRNGQPVGEVGIDRESSPGLGQWYMKHYASGTDLSGYDSYNDAVDELKYCMKQGVTEVFEYGNRVQHPKYGAGQVIQVYSNGTITVNFPDYPDPIDKKPGVRSNFAPGDKDYQSLKPVAEAQTDYQKRRQRERDVDAGRPVQPLPKNPRTDYQKKREQDRKDMELGEAQTCSECGGPSFSDLLLAEKQDACYHKVKSRYKVWPSAYASGALVQCRKKGAANWGNKK